MGYYSVALLALPGGGADVCVIAESAFYYLDREREKELRLRDQARHQDW